MNRLISAVFVFLCLIILVSFQAAAQEEIRFVDRSGASINHLSVALSMPDGAASPFDAQVNQMTQLNSLFAPFILTVKVGDTVSFPNFDTHKHHVYSFSPAKRFELKLYGNDEDRSIVFDQVGTVALGCNIHDNMLAFIRVSDQNAVAGLDENGVLKLVGQMPDEWTLELWHPDIDRRADGVEDGIYRVSGRGLPAEPIIVPLRKRRTIQKEPADRNY